ncbi:MAG: PAS domain S-box protein, partial [Bacteroidota bacterium]|nr:PAS domain S-box protein [Bacteroidota bacterium]
MKGKLDYSSLLFALPSPVFLINKTEERYVLTFANRAALSLIGLDEVVIGSNLFDLFKNEAQFLSYISTCLNSEETIRGGAIRLVRSALVQHNYEPIFSFVEPNFVLLTLIEKTATVKERVEEDKFFSKFIKESPAALAMLDQNMCYIAASNKWIEDYHLEGIDLIGKSHYEIFPEINADWKTIHQWCLKGNKAKREIDSFTRTDGTVQWMSWEINPWFKNDGESGGIVMFTEIITERVELQNELIKNTLKLNNILQNLPVGLSIKTKDDKVAYFNQAFIEITGYSVEDVPDVDTFFLQAFPDEMYREKIRKDWLEKEEKAERLGEKCEPMRARITCKDGSEKIIERIISEIADEIVSIYTDITEIKKAKYAIEASEVRFKAITEQTDEGIGLTDLQGNYIFVNQSFCKMLGFSEEELLQMNVSDFRVSNEYEASAFNRVLEAKNLRINKVQLLRKDKSKIITDVKGKVIKINGEDFVLGVINDVTKQVENELEIITSKERAEENEFRLMLATESAQLAIWEWKIKEDILICDQRMMDMYGAENLSNYNLWAQCVHPDDIDRVAEEIRLSIFEARHFNSQFRIIKPTKEIAYLKANGLIVKDNTGETIKFIGVNQDITDQVQAEIKLKQSEERQRALIENIGDTIILVNRDLRVIYQSPNYVNTAGIPLSEVQDKTVVDLVYEEDKPVLFNLITEAFNAPNTPLPILIRVLNRDGNPIWIEGTVKNMLDNESVQSFIVNYRDITTRIESEKELKNAKLKSEESEMRLNEAQLITKVGSWETDLLNLNVIWSEETYHIFELDFKSFEASHKAFLSFVYPDDVFKVDEAFMASFTTKGYNYIEHRIITAKGNLKFVEERWKIVYNETGVPIKAVGTCQDISARKKIEQDLSLAKERAEENAFRFEQASKEIQEQELRYRTLFESSTDTILLICDGVFIDCNSSALKLFGCSKQEILQARPCKFSPTFQPNGKKSHLEEERLIGLTLTGKPQFFEWEHIRLNGESFIAEVGLNYLILDGKPHVQALVRDISDRKKAHEQLALSALIINFSNDAIISKTIDGVITSWNPGAEKIYGFLAHEVLGKSIHEVIGERFIEEELRITNEVVIGKNTVQCESQRIRKDGKVIDVSLTLSPILNEAGNIIGTSKIIRDITERKKLEAERANIVNDLVQRNRELEQFSYIVSHNLRAPVTNIMGITDYISQYNVEPNEQLAMMQGLSKSAKVLDEVLFDLNYI